MLQGLLSPWHELVRLNTLKLGERLAKSGAGAGHLHLLDMMRLEHADAQPRYCAEFYRLLIELIRTIPSNPPQVGSVIANLAFARESCWVYAKPHL